MDWPTLRHQPDSQAARGARNRRHERSDTHDVHDTGQIVGQDVQRHLGGHLGKALHQEVGCSHPGLDRAEGMLNRLAALARSGKAAASSRTSRSGLRLVHRRLRHARFERGEGATRSAARLTSTKRNLSFVAASTTLMPSLT